jgi:hypothetical protein
MGEASRTFIVRTSLWGYMWRGEWTFVFKAADPEIVEEWKWVKVH